MSQSCSGAIHKRSHLKHWIAGVLFWGLTGAALAEATGIAPGAPVTGNIPSSHKKTDRLADRPQWHPHALRTAYPSSVKVSSVKRERNDSATPDEYQLRYGNTNLLFSVVPALGESRYSGGTPESQILTRDSARYGLPAASNAQSSATVPDDNWRFTASPLMNATHAHEIGATVSARHDF
ncbi:hypothetical protein [Paraburkholderia solisilvae]|uniref:hypothetical protein n=1 Tax=Paraburkholderia solisilvae TaxID=624376 RepID=UPI001582C6B5|nr:hypothetical protein [Paraburkholderia solisilvae]